MHSRLEMRGGAFFRHCMYTSIRNTHTITFSGSVIQRFACQQQSDNASCRIWKVFLSKACVTTRQNVGLQSEKIVSVETDPQSRPGQREGHVTVVKCCPFRCRQDEEKNFCISRRVIFPKEKITRKGLALSKQKKR